MSPPSPPDSRPGNEMSPPGSGAGGDGSDFDRVELDDSVQPPELADAHRLREFEKLLRMVRNEHAKLVKENEDLKAQVLVARARDGTSMAGHQTAADEAARPTVMTASQTGGSDGEAGHSIHVRRLASAHMDKMKEKGGKQHTTFGFQGAKKVKAKLKWVRNSKFDIVFACVILLNALYIGVETSMTLNEAKKNRENGGNGQIDRKFWILGDMIFLSLYSFELVVRVFAYQVKFFLGSQRWWNYFDVVTIVAGIMAVSLELNGAPPSFHLNVFKVMRLARLVRTLKTSRSRVFYNLRTLCYTIAGSANAFTSAISMLFVVMYVFGVMFMQGVQEYVRKPEATSAILAQLCEYFGDIPNTSFTLLNCITGGINWKEVALALWEINASYKWFFTLYITFTVLCVLNILNGVFVNVAIESAQTNKDLAIETTKFKTRAIIAQMLEWFVEADKDMSGKVSWEELRGHLEDEKVNHIFMAHNIDVSSASTIFELLDKDGSGELTPDEFVDNLINLQGGAKAIDLASLRKVCDDMSQRVLAMEKALGL